VSQQRIDCRIDKNGQRPVNHHRGDGNGYFAGLGFDHRFSRQHCRCAANAAACANQPTGFSVQPKHFCPSKQASIKVLESIKTSIVMPLTPTSAICENVRRKP
jgi:hypothetical protein